MFRVESYVGNKFWNVIHIQLNIAIELFNLPINHSSA